MPYFLRCQRWNKAAKIAVIILWLCVMFDFNKLISHPKFLFTWMRFNFVNALLKNLSKFRGQSKGKLLVNKIINYWVSPLGLFSSESVGNIFATVWLGFVCWVSWTLCVDASYERERAWFIQLWTKVLRHFNKTNAFHLKFRYLVLTLQWLFELSIIEFWKIAG